MKKSEVKVGTTHRVKVSGQITDVRITRENPRGGWDGINTATNRPVRIKSAQRLRSVAKRPANRKKIVTLAEYEAEAQASDERAAGQVRKDITQTVEAVRKGDLTKGVTVPTGTKDAKKAAKASKATTKRDTGKRGANTGQMKAKRVSLVAAAAQILAKAAEPMKTKEMVEQAVAQGLWAPGKGKTPEATLYSAIIREIRHKGEDSRFVKIERGKFTLHA